MYYNIDGGTGSRKRKGSGAEGEAEWTWIEALNFGLMVDFMVGRVGKEDLALRARLMVARLGRFAVLV